MNIVSVMVLSIILYGFPANGVGTNVSTRPDVVNIGAIFAFTSIVGKVAKVAMEAAVEDVNSIPSVLGGTKPKLTMQDSNYSGFLSLIEGLRFMEKDIVAIIGPQSSVAAHVISHIANELQVPLLSFAATDPTLTALQFPFFLRTTQNDLFQMDAIAEIVAYYGWREVIAIYADDDYGRNGIAALGDKLAERRCKISYKAPMVIRPSRDEITDVLVKVALTESRILVLHTYDVFGPQVLTVAKRLGMMESGYVWIATNWLSTVLDTDSSVASDVMDDFQGVITLRMYTPDSELKMKFASRWSNLTSAKSANGAFGLSSYGLYTYDTVWILAHAINAFFNKGGNISFSNDSRLSELREGNLHLDAMSIFNGGNLLLDRILKVNITCVTGPINFTSDRNLVNPAYEIINVIGTGFRRIGYWSNYSGLSVVTPETFYEKPPNLSSSNQQLYSVIWPGQTAQNPRGWVFPNNRRHLRIGVPNRIGYGVFISKEEDTDMFTGYCIDVFNAALNLLPYAVPYKLIPFGDGLQNPSFTGLVRLITTGEYDAAIGDITITPNRTRMADFTQPYIESGLVVVTSVRKTNSDAWAFFRPFTPTMWVITSIFFLVVGSVVWVLEHRRNDDFRGPPKRQVVTILWFSFSTYFFAHRENTVSTLGRLVLIIWLFVVLIINSSYTASLTSILTVQQLYSPIKGIESLISSDDLIGYQQGSFARNYLIHELGIHESRLIPLKSQAEYAKALKGGSQNGGVAVVVDERAYVELFLSTRCEFSIVGQEFTKNGWGFAFHRDSPLAVDMSTAILKLSENGDLQRIHDKWLLRGACSLQGAKLGNDRLHLSSFSGLFLMCGITCLLALFIYFVQIFRQFRRHHSEQFEGSSGQSAGIRTFLTFVDRKEEEVKHLSKKRQMEDWMNSSKRRHIELSSNTSVSTGD